MKINDVKILKNRKIAKDIYKMVVYSPAMAKETKPGQFYEIKVSDTYDPILRRPISIGLVEKDLLIFYYKVVGKGTGLMSKFEKDEFINILGPLGETFPINKDKNALIIGGGIGIAPLIYLSEYLKLNNNRVKFLAGFHSQKDIYIEDLYSILTPGDIKVFTDNGSTGMKGFPTDNLEEIIGDYDIVYTCGPEIMMKRANKIATERNIPIFHSLEEIMGCGVGVCMGCAVDTVDGYKLVCKDGPVFNGRNLKW
ncbi:MAG: dihydroorotate dehydrogenase electron transfer subunit [Candidatus Mcinerneyibacterium aminivorans]|uniref:Dihydroorotate dehydrogenase B (NAD(+)), electron transfer subunit n=1 Tax=Candidatus Mcinerneyibacterium aminivorans TaxID=2703815 RepID=A0A5D0MI99_9BACT|nr:MAG: dihydroorotate dehydrogenase electron transfer subunit [Candidatus Mcinerneyibacterium aminivorans]